MPESKEQITNTAVLAYGAPQRREELLELLGGKHVLHQAVDKFYESLREDHRLDRFFHGTNVELLKWHQFNFMSVAFSTIPKGLDIHKMVLEKHKRLFEMGLNETHFDIMMAHLRSTFAHFSIKEDLIEEAVQALMPLRSIFSEGAALAKTREHEELVWHRVHIAVTIATLVGFVGFRYLKRAGR